MGQFLKLPIEGTFLKDNSLPAQNLELFLEPCLAWLAQNSVLRVFELHPLCQHVVQQLGFRLMSPSTKGPISLHAPGHITSEWPILSRVLPLPAGLIYLTYTLTRANSMKQLQKESHCSQSTMEFQKIPSWPRSDQLPYCQYKARREGNIK